MSSLWLFLVLFLFPEIAFANPITEGVDWVMDLLTNGIARSAAVIGIAILGYLAWFGRITGETCGKYIAGIVLVFGGTTIVDMIISAVK
ncbi:TrbC/VirB2 family protein [Shewanella sp. 202IG2-18]|nr:TrbC/VirB2 family protein [Parashewanella hymeniacidonis]